MYSKFWDLGFQPQKLEEVIANIYDYKRAGISKEEVLEELCETYEELLD